MAEDGVERWSPLLAGLYSLIARDPKSNRVLVEIASVDEGDVFLDIGCGPGAALERAAATGARVAGVDPSPSMVKRAARRVPEAEVKVGSAEDLPFTDDSFTVVASISSFHHWADRQAGLSEALRVLRPGGRLHIMEGRVKGRHGHGLTESEAASLAAKLEELGYQNTGLKEIPVGRWRTYYLVSGTVPDKV